MITDTKHEMPLIAHLLRRAGFGAPYDELEKYAAMGYEATVEELLRPEDQPVLEEDMLFRTNPGWQDLATLEQGQAYWLYRMVNSKRSLQEKMALFWHGVLCSGYAKVDANRQMTVTVDNFRYGGLNSFRDILVQLAKDPGMIYYLDNCMSHKGAVNENWGRELLELFSMGVGNYTENDVKEAARAFTGWNNEPTSPSYPYGHCAWKFTFDASDHDEAEKAFLGSGGRLNGEDTIDIICQQPATARFVARHLYNFFVADEAPVPQWATTPPKDPAAIEALANAYFQHSYDIRSILRVLFNSDFFKNARFFKMKGPAEVVAGTMRLVKDFKAPEPGFYTIALQCRYIGQDILNPPTVEGWHTGQEWIDSGILVERVNFVSEHIGDVTKAGVEEMIARLRGKGSLLTADEFIDGCLEQLGFALVNEDTRAILVDNVRLGGPVRTDANDFAPRTTQLLRLITATQEYQFC